MGPPCGPRPQLLQGRQQDCTCGTGYTKHSAASLGLLVLETGCDGDPYDCAPSPVDAACLICKL